MLATSPKMQAYFDRIKKDCFDAFAIATKARAQGYDPTKEVEVVLAETLGERVVGLISVLAPQIKGSGADKRIEELEKEYGILDWRVAFTIALEIAQQKYCTFKDQKESIEIGVRTGFAYVTLGVVSSPLEGLTSIDLKPRRDGRGLYFRINYAGPIRNAGGTAAAVSVLIADYVRVMLGFDVYDPTEEEIKRCPVELEDYHHYVANLQYWPSKEESIFLMRHLPVEIAGDGSETREISNVTLKDLPRVETNNLRSGYCLIHSSCIPLKAPKLWQKLEKWGEKFRMGHWSFLKEYNDLQKKMRAKGKKEESVRISPDYTYIKDLVAGRPVFAHPLRPGGFRLRYGRTRVSGFSAQAVHPATMIVLDDFLAVGTQLKVERPGKAAAFGVCDSIDGPIVRLTNGRVLKLSTETEARQLRTKIAEILFLGDVLINYGDFYDRAHLLVPPGYTPEFWALEVKKALAEQQKDIAALAMEAGMAESRLTAFLETPLLSTPSFDEAYAISTAIGVPLHAEHTYYWTLLTHDQHTELHSWLESARVFDERPSGGRLKLLLPFTPERKRLLELAGVPHDLATEDVLLFDDAALSLLHLYGNRQTPDTTGEIVAKLLQKEKEILVVLNGLATTKLRDKAGIFIGSRMGRPEKAKQRQMTGTPHTLFPIGEQGGRMRSYQAALEAGFVHASYPVKFCPACKQKTPLPRCETCDAPTVQLLHCDTCGDVESCPHEPKLWADYRIDFPRIFNATLKKLGYSIYPDLIKGVRGTSNKSHLVEHPAKGIVRAKHDVYVNKDGTIRYDASELTLTHFKPGEVGASVARLIALGYTHDIDGMPLVSDDQVLELFPQDVVLPCCPSSPDEPADAVLARAAGFVDELLKRLYGLPAYHNLSGPRDLIGQYIIGLAPHTSAGIIGRIVGFSKTQGFLAHPLFHAAMRRDCDGDESCFLLLMDTFLNFSRKYLGESRGSTMDAPLVLTILLNPAEVDDMAFNVDIVGGYPLELYEAGLAFKKPNEIKVRRLGDVLGTPAQFEGMRFTHPTSDINAGVLCSAYKTLPSMEEKLEGQMKLADKIRACDAPDVARLVIEKHFLRDTKGNLRKFSQQEYRCVNCNEKYRRPPLRGSCKECNGKVIFTITEGSVVKYLEPSIRLAKKYNLPAYLQQDLELTKRRVEANFGRDADRQEGLDKFFG